MLWNYPLGECMIGAFLPEPHNPNLGVREAGAAKWGKSHKSWHHWQRLPSKRVQKHNSITNLLRHSAMRKCGSYLLILGEKLVRLFFVSWFRFIDDCLAFVRGSIAYGTSRNVLYNYCISRLLFFFFRFTNNNMSSSHYPSSWCQVTTQWATLSHCGGCIPRKRHVSVQYEPLMQSVALIPPALC